MSAKLIISFERLSEAEFLAQVLVIQSSLANNPAFPQPWPLPSPSYEELMQAIVAYQEAYQAAIGHDTHKIAKRHAAREYLVGILKRLANYLELASYGDASALGSTGYQVSRETTRPTVPVVLTAPTGMSVKRGELGGVLVVHATRLQGAGSYEVQLAESDPTQESNWNTAGIHVHCSHIELTGLTPGKRYSVRLRGIGSAGPGAWSDVITLMAV